jgi:hypothetical protein
MALQGRPVLVWMVLVYFMLASGAWVFSVASLDPGIMTPTDYTVGIFLLLLYLVAAVALFLMRKLAFYFFVGAVLMEILLLVLGGGSRTEVMTVGGDLETIVQMISIAVSVALCVYAFLLSSSGRLR